MADLQFTATINGRKIARSAKPHQRLLDFIRDDLNLTGTRYGCCRGQCGACYVIADSRAVASCLLTADQAARMEITTI